MKKIIAALLSCSILLAPGTTVYADFDYSLLDDLSETELQDLKDEVDKRLEDISETADSETNETSTDETSNWEAKYYVDEFKNPTDEGYITNAGVFEGTFSNSAANNEKLLGYFIVDKYGVSICLYEYGDIEVVNPYSSIQEYYILILDQDGEKQKVNGEMSKRGDRITIRQDDKILDIMKKDGEISFYIAEEEGMSEYYFKVDCTGFSEVYSEMFG